MTRITRMTCCLVLAAALAPPPTSAAPPARPSPAVTSAPAPVISAESALDAPAGWHVRRETRPDHVALFITKENIQTNGGFLTGLSINSNARFQARQKIAPLDYARGIAQVAKAGHARSSLSEVMVAPDLHVVEVAVIDDTRLPETDLVFLYVADARADTVHQVTFETPSAIREAEWPHGTRLIKEFIQLVANGRLP